MRARLAIFLIAVAACSTTAENIDEASEFAEHLENKERSIVFGRVRWIENGEEKRIGTGYFEMRLRPDLVRMQDNQRVQTSVDEGGHFCWALEPGVYLMHRIVYWDKWTGNYILIPKVAFNVPEAGKIYYVGTLHADFQKKRTALGHVSGDIHYTIRNEQSAESAHLREQCGLANRPLSSSLMIRDDRLPKTVETTTAFQMAATLLMSYWITGMGNY